MIRSKSAKIILLTMTITAIVFLLKPDVIGDAVRILNNFQDNQLRHLVTDQQIHDICNSAFGNKYTNLAMNYTQLFESKVQTLGNIFIPAQTGDYQLIIDYIQNSTLTNNVVQYAIKRGTPYLVFIAFAVVSLITWIVLCICSCKPCFCCKKSESDGICKTITVILIVLCYAGVIIGSVIGFIYAVNFVEAMNGTTCAVMVFYQDTVHGQNTTATPRWIGINQISNVLDNTITAIDTVIANEANAFPATDDDNGSLADFTNTLDSSNTDYSGSYLDNPNPILSQVSDPITPLYIHNYGDYTTVGTTLDTIYQEFDTKLQASYAIRTNAKGYVSNFANNVGNVKQQITVIKQAIEGFQTPFNSFSNNVITNWINVQNQINNIGVVAFFILFAVLISMSVGSIFLLFCYGTCCKWQWLRFVMHFIWWLFSLIMILTFLLGGAFGIVGLIGEDGTPVLQWIFGTVNLNSPNPAIFGTGNTPLYINTCVNIDGDLIAHNLSLDQYGVELNLMYQASLTLQSTKTTLASNVNSATITAINTSYNAIINDITLTTDNTFGNNDISSMLFEFRGWTDAGQNRYQKGCTPPTYDVWTHNESGCPAGYPMGAAVGSQSCLLIPGFTGTQAKSRYGIQSNCQSWGSSNFNDNTDAAYNYVNNLNQYITDNRNLLNQLITQNGVLNTKFSNIAQNILTFLTNMQGVITPLINIFESIVGNSGLFTIVNCAFMKTDLNNLYLEMQNDLAPKAFSLGGIIIAVSFLQYLSVICLFILINKFRKTDESYNATGVIMEMKEQA